MLNPIVIFRDLVHLTQAAVAGAYTSITAAGGGDNTAITGTTIDRSLFNYAPGLLILVPFRTTLAQAATLTFKTVKIEHSADNFSTAADYLTMTDPGVVSTGGAGGSTNTGVFRLSVNVQSANRYIRFDMTPDLSAGGTDTATMWAVALFGGYDENPPGTVANPALPWSL